MCLLLLHSLPNSQETTAGNRKVVDLIDTSGSGDVDTSTIRKTTDSTNRVIEGLTGRKLCIPDDWENGSGQWHVGLKAAFELFPSRVKSRLQVKKDCVVIQSHRIIQAAKFTFL